MFRELQDIYNANWILAPGLIIKVIDMACKGVTFRRKHVALEKGNARVVIDLDWSRIELNQVKHVISVANSS